MISNVSDCCWKRDSGYLWLYIQPGTHFQVPVTVWYLSLALSCFCSHLKTELFSRVYSDNSSQNQQTYDSHKTQIKNKNSKLAQTNTIIRDFLMIVMIIILIIVKDLECQRLKEICRVCQRSVCDGWACLRRQCLHSCRDRSHEVSWTDPTHYLALQSCIYNTRT